MASIAIWLAKRAWGEWLLKYWRVILIALIAVALAYAVYRVYEWDQSRLTQKYNEGHAAAKEACEIRKARAIIQGKTSRERIDHEFKSNPVSHADRFNADHGFMRD